MQLSEYKTALEGQKSRLAQELLEELAYLDNRIKEAVRLLDEGRLPNTLGVVQGSGSTIDNIVGRMAELENTLRLIEAGLAEEALRGGGQ